jgi:hypothetical protein
MVASKTSLEVVSEICGVGSVEKNRPVMPLLAALLVVIGAAVMPYPVEAKARVVRGAIFNAEDEQIIARNEALTQLVKKNPQAVLRVLDLIEGAHLWKAEGTQVGGSGEGRSTAPVG